MSNPNKVPYMGNSTMSLKDVAKKHKLSYSYLQQVSAREKWGDQKKEIIRKATEGALEEVEGSLKNLIVRHAKVARWLQNAGLSRLQKRIQEISASEKGLSKKKVRQIKDRLLLSLVSEGLKAERELYPKQLQVEGGFDVGVDIGGISKALDKAIYLTFRKSLGRKRPSIHDGRKVKSKKSGKNSTKK